MRHVKSIFAVLAVVLALPLAAAVKNNQVGLQGFSLFDGVGGLSANLETSFLEKSADDLANGITVVNEQDLAASRGRDRREVCVVGLDRLRHADLTAAEAFFSDVRR